MNQYVKNLNRIEFVITYACTGKCKHCSEAERLGGSEHIDGDVGAQAVFNVAKKYNMESMMTFGGEPLLYPKEVCKIHAAARDAGIEKRQLITNGFFSKDIDKIGEVAEELARSGVNAILLSVDAFHQETIPLEPVKAFAKAVKEKGVYLRTQPAWLVNEEADNPYNKKTKELLKEFKEMGMESSEGNVIFPSGNAVKYLKEYFDMDKKIENPYIENPKDIRAICIGPDGGVLDGNIYEKDILKILSEYSPKDI